MPPLAACLTLIAEVIVSKLMLIKSIQVAKAFLLRGNDPASKLGKK